MGLPLVDQIRSVLERPHRLGMIGGDLDEQLAHCASFFAAIGQSGLDPDGNPGPYGRAVDLGTGGGVPGIPLAAWVSGLSWTLIEVRASRATEVERAVLRLGIDDRIEVASERAEVLAHRAAYRELADLAVARAFGPPAMTAECAGGLLRVGGRLVVSEPPDSEPDRWPAQALAALGFGPARVVEVSDGRFAVMEKQAPISTQLPRRPAKPGRGWVVSRETTDPQG